MATQSQSTKSKLTSPIGDSGVQIFNGIISGEEYNFKLLGLRAIQTYDEMRRSDASVNSSLEAIVLPLMSLSWNVEAASEDPKDQEIADFVGYNLFEILRWRVKLGEILTHLPFGFSVHEKVYEFRQVDGKDRIALGDLAYRKQTSIVKWEADQGAPGVTQRLTNGQTVGIPLYKLAVFTHKQEGDNYEGISILRSAYKHWYYVDKLYQIDAVGHERQALGVVKIHHPKGASDKDRKNAQSAARNLRANQEAYIEEPEGWDINFMDMKGGTLKDIKPSIDHHVRQISRNVLAQFLDLGATSGSGSRAVGETHLDLFEKAVESVADTIADTINTYVIRDLVDLNFNVTSYPKLTHGRVSDDSMTEVADAFQKFTQAGAITPTEEDERHLRSLLRLPRMAEDKQGSAADKAKKDKPKTDPETGEDDSTKEVKGSNGAIELARRAKAKITGLLYGDQNRAA